MERYCWSRLTSLQVGKYGECLAKLKFMEYGFGIFCPEVADGEIDLVLRKGMDAYFEVQVKTIRNLNCINLPRVSFTPRFNLLVVIILLEDRQPPRSYLIPSTAWRKPDALLVDRDYEGQSSQPGYGLNLSERTRALLDRFEFHRVIQQMLAGSDDIRGNIAEISTTGPSSTALPKAEAVTLEELAAPPVPNVEPENPCRICGQQIEAGRLRAVPQTDACASCVKELSESTHARAPHTPPAQRLSGAELERVKQKSIAAAEVPQIRWPKDAPRKCPRCGGPTEIRLLGYNRMPVVACMKDRTCRWRFTRPKRRR